MKKMTSRIFIIAALLIASNAWAASVTQVKGKKALVDLTGQDGARAGDEFYAMSAEGKKRAILRLSQVKKGKAVADIVKGRAEIGQDLQPKSLGKSISRDVRESDLPAGEEPIDSAYARRIRKRYSGASWGILGSMLQTNMTASFKSGTGFAQRDVSAEMKGSTFGVLGFYDYPLAPQFQLRGMGGLEQVSASGTLSNPDCDNGKSATCTFNVTYLSLYGAGKFNFYDEGRMRMWVLGGWGFLLAASKSSNVISTGQITTNQIISLSLGADIPMGRANYIPVSIEYGMFPASDSVKANILTIRAGYAWTL